MSFYCERLQIVTVIIKNKLLKEKRMIDWLIDRVYGVSTFVGYLMPGLVYTYIDMWFLNEPFFTIS